MISKRTTVRLDTGTKLTVDRVLSGELRIGDKVSGPGGYEGTIIAIHLPPRHRTKKVRGGR